MNVVAGRTEGAPRTADVDVVVVGSGTGGAVVAHTLASEGRSVLVLEEGGHYPADEYQKLPPMQAIRRLAREAGLGVAVGLGDTPLIATLAGKCVGGSSVLTGGVCFRIPDDVLHDWSTRLGLVDMTPDTLAPYFEEAERRIKVETVPEHMRSRSTELFVEGADKLGIAMKPLRRNTSGCQGAARCNFGCPHGAKMSVDISFLPEAARRGAVVWSDALVERVVHTGGVARGVRGRFLDRETGEPRVPFEVRAKVVVVACGSMHTPLLLKKSGVGGVHVGKHLTLHPAVRVGALFDEEVGGWDGALQSVYSDHFQDEGITLVGVYSPVNVLAAAFPGVGRDHKRLARRSPNLAVFGGMIHDDGGGAVHKWLSREPLVTYRMAKRDKGRLMRTIQVLGEMAFAAGAKEVLLPIFGTEPVTSPAALDALTTAPPKASRVECLAFHPLGSARMSHVREGGVVAENGESWDVKNLFVLDGSILPTSIGVNSQLPIMGVVTRLAHRLADAFDGHARVARWQ